MYYSGVDSHNDNCFLTTANDSGEIVKHGRMRNEYGSVNMRMDDATDVPTLLSAVFWPTSPVHFSRKCFQRGFSYST
jgi:hypothetical protein